MKCGVFSCFYMKMWPTYKTKDTFIKGKKMVAQYHLMPRFIREFGIRNDGFSAQLHKKRMAIPPATA